MSQAGTTPWMAPEYLEGKDFTEKCDVFSFAIVMWEILMSCCSPYPGKNPSQIISLVGKGESARWCQLAAARVFLVCRL